MENTNYMNNEDSIMDFDAAILASCAMARQAYTEDKKTYEKIMVDLANDLRQDLSAAKRLNKELLFAIGKFVAQDDLSEDELSNHLKEIIEMGTRWQIEVMIESLGGKK
jgi:hypothetical protein